MTLAEEAIATCHAHLAATNSFGTDIEAYLVRVLLVLICSETEETIEVLVEQRAAAAGDGQLTSFVKSATGQLLRRARVGDLANLLGRFSGQVRDGFHATVANTHAAFDTIVSNRLQVAHTTGTVQLTFHELEQRYEESKQVVRVFAGALGLVSPI